MIPLGPNHRHRTRQQHVRYRTRLLADFYIPPPSPKQVKALMDEKSFSDVQVDNFFDRWIQMSEPVLVECEGGEV